MPALAFISTAHVHTGAFIEGICKATDGRRVHAIWDDAAERGRRQAQACGARFEPDLARLIEDPAIDGFVICSENIRHFELLRRALPAGKPVLCEKPLVTDLGDLHALCRLIKQHPAPLLCGYYHPFDADALTIAQLVEENALGHITRATCRNFHHGAYARWFEPVDFAWFCQPALSGGGAFLDMGTHAVHLLRTLLGPVTDVWATTRNESGVPPGCDDHGVAHLKFASGVFGTVEAAWTQTGGVSGLELVGSSRTVWNTHEGYVVATPEKPPQRLQLTRPALLSRIDRLVAVIEGRISADELQADLVASLDTVAIMAACYESARSGRWTTVPAIPFRHQFANTTERCTRLVRTSSPSSSALP